MAGLKTFDPDHDLGEILETMRTDGGAIIRDAMSPEQCELVRDELGPWVESTPLGRDDFTGRQTGRTGALVARSPACRDLVMDERVVGLANGFLAPYTNRIQLHLTQVITIHPGQGKQPLHRDRLAWGGYIPNEIEPQFNTIWALTDFTEENGATRVVPGSVSWDHDRRPTDDEKTQAVMDAGSVLLYTGSVIHGGGQNESDSSRSGINITYCLGWLRTEENQYLSCPPEVARDLDPALQEMLGYTMGNYALGYFSDPGEIRDGVTDLLPPELALGRRPRPDSDLAITGLL
ncbi:MAG: phytanoyl-CoA dioxygenase family protein [Actinomycetota bacterium]